MCNVLAFIPIAIFTLLSPAVLNSTGKCRYWEPTEILWQKQRFNSDKWDFANTSSCTYILSFRNLRSLVRIFNFPWDKTMQNQNLPSARRTEESQELQKAFNTKESCTAKVIRGTCKTVAKFDPMASIRLQNLHQGNHRWAGIADHISVVVTCCWHMARAHRSVIAISQCSHITSVSPGWGWTFSSAVGLHAETTCNARCQMLGWLQSGPMHLAIFGHSPLNNQEPPRSGPLWRAGGPQRNTSTTQNHRII